MFDLAFFKVVGGILHWKEAPPAVFVNEHQDAVSQKKNPNGALDSIRAKTMTMGHTDRLLHLYVRATYPRYFGLTLHAGATPRSYVDKCFIE